MNKLLEEGIEAARKLPEAEQTLAGELLMTLAMRPELSPEQIKEVRLAQVEVAGGAFASDEQITAFWEKCGV